MKFYVYITTLGYTVTTKKNDVKSGLTFANLKTLLTWFGDYISVMSFIHEDIELIFVGKLKGEQNG